ncbi:VanZ like family protein [Gracilibacillus orientalis]|uniref:VanZ like family protein n=1 Tax=Gracilibacillus orientalis TaxID=334253 RepID=A0A1I4P874_9BACI|nr:VanZ family protein [Gracilibacillus orientalis]SFM24008.1 VanZ like family protein [Gracilibacillus orientalis]
MKKLIYWVFPILWMGVIYYSSDQPYEKQDIKPLLSQYIDISFLDVILQPIAFSYHQSIVSVEQLGVEGVVEFFIRKGAHVGVFCMLCGLFYLAYRKTWQNKNVTLLTFFAFFTTLLYAVFDEWHQGLTPNRTPYTGDVVLDGIGALIALFVILLVNKLRK